MLAAASTMTALQILRLEPPELRSLLAAPMAQPRRLGGMVFRSLAMAPPWFQVFQTHHSTVQEFFLSVVLEEHLGPVRQVAPLGRLRLPHLLRTGLQTRCSLEGGRHFLVPSGAVQAGAAVVATQLVELAQAALVVAVQARSWSTPLR
jgi:hypothetical protein